ncbi:signal recognition particle-docking protein FtsY [Rhodococcus sp. 05-2256-B2]|uniref:signal recognition particle-docking protein FtsY n=1 Tax=unclassified Rhodococcus (in: high G+C Gram-positive bacteria) TaxID=192944 RepID=UPI000B9A4930|nr:MULTISPECIES: signal recognition particle-docking protein FtsY [unclassified Rhodococcus (in: high G+C Gram-positive bacteria)]OZD82937.1 signal recognition particle-docking protein FtsY [Rhodococcus sp. 05-2256-B4]OZD96196.1 signal recognition particle-docking protein FtsY [Rhodococcus sp. 05-2256-B2]OZD96618.1 signal recognition particle-docking protein FtsY [Rhodococcus sp. 05-2256-B3]OZD99594.1 signal recognition particle-docking protein FtsY [Rhodococcus sp. 05-2256-B1]
MSNQAWIIVAAIAAVLLVVLVAGFVLAHRRRVSLKSDEAARIEDAATKDRSGGYTAGSGFSFSQGTATAEPVPPAPKPVETFPVEPTPVPPTHTRDEPEVLDPEVPVVEPQVPVVEPAEPAEPTAPAVPEPAPDAEAPAPRLDTIDPTEGRLDRLRGRLARSQSAVGKSLLGLLGGGDLDEDSWEEVEDTLLIADIGSATTTEIMRTLREQMAARSIRTEADARALLREILVAQLHPEFDRSIRALPHDGAPAVLLVVGVNGTGKTTTTGKLARVLVADGRRVLLGAADTFRAAAADQLQTWAERVGAEVVRGKEAADPAAVAFDAVSKGIENGVDVVLVDTAGRLHTKSGLMDELSKVKRVIEKRAHVDDVLLVLDATVGQNGLTQARVFAEIVDITGVVLTKLDGTAKGGIVFQVQRELGVPVKLVGLGEGADDLAPFEPGAFVDALLG